MKAAFKQFTEQTADSAWQTSDTSIKEDDPAKPSQQESQTLYPKID